MGDTGPNVTLHEASAADVPVLRRLMQLYLYDLGTIDGWDIGEDGLFGSAERIESFWTEDGRRTLLIRVDGVLAGFLMIRDGGRFSGPGTRELAEFFVLRKYRRRGVGTRAATAVFDMLPGRWEVDQLASNAEAQAFWRAVIGRYTGGRFDDAERRLGTWRGRVQHFHAP
ncbi:MAG TPA: GNAT family N-acetyltransferase [Methylomirabilota bacterium]|nr:GNAT family N-acetyltransferase [Methylomirabilota bacterium]